MTQSNRNFRQQATKTQRQKDHFHGPFCGMKGIYFRPLPPLAPWVYNRWIDTKNAGDLVMAKVTLRINGADHPLDIPSDMPLLWALRDKLNMTGTKYSCGIGQCGTCTVLVDGEPERSCRLKAKNMAGKEITTIEGLDPTGNHPVQKAWNEEDVPQCGYCQGGQILTAAALLKKNPKPDDAAIDEAMDGNLCRCGTYFRIRKAIKLAAVYMADEGGA
jgi:isoquinoline 1-oxidoreductase alpha subunit